MKPLAWSHTSLEDFVNCPRAYYEKRIAKSVKEDQSEALIWGDFVHKRFEARQKTGEPLPEELGQHEKFMAILESMPGKASVEKRIALNTSREPCGFFDQDVWYRGVIDYLKVNGSEATVLDYKTGKQHSKFNQLKLFAIHTFAEYKSVDSVHVKFYWTQSEMTTGERYTRDQIPSLWSSFIPNLKQYKQAFKEDTWQPRPSGLCYGWCPVTDCEFWKPKRARR